MAFKFNLYLDQGSDYIIEMGLLDDLGKEINITDFQLYAQFRKGYGSKKSYNFKTTEIDAPTGTISLEYSAAESSLLTPGSYVYDVVLYNPTISYTLRVVEGELIVSPGVTII